jgi:hypothetical protein
MVIGVPFKTSSAATGPAPSTANTEFGAESLLVLCVIQALPDPVVVEVHPAGSAGAVTPSKFSAYRGAQVSAVVQGFPSSQLLVLGV